MKKNRFFLCLSVLFALLCAAQTAAARIYLDISSAELRKVPMAVPFFIDKLKPGSTGDFGHSMAATISQALDFHGFISIIPTESYNGQQEANWLALGAEFTLLGQFLKEQTELIVELRLVDNSDGRMILGRRYRGEIGKQNLMLLRFCDEVIQTLTGERGISLTDIAFVSDESGDDEIYIADVMGTEKRQITKHHSITISPRFSPDGTKLAYTSYHRKNPNLYVTNLLQSSTTQAVSRRKGLNVAATWSPDGESMAITLSQDGNPDLYLIDNKGEILRKLTKDEGINVSPSWSPDGSQLAFVSDRSGSPQIYIMDVKSRNVKRITYLGNYNTTPAWSPRGDVIAYSGFYEGAYHLYTISPKAGTPTRITRYWGDHESPSWSPDGRQIVFSRGRKDEKKIYTIFRDGSGLRELFPDFKGKQSYPQWSPRKKL